MTDRTDEHWNSVYATRAADASAGSRLVPDGYSIYSARLPSRHDVEQNPFHDLNA